MSVSLRAWLLAAGFMLAGVGWLWWSTRQWLDIVEISASEFVMPAGRLLLWMITLVISGFSFGMVMWATRRDPQRVRGSILAVFAIVPAAVLFFFWSQTSLGWFSEAPPALIDFIYNETTLGVAGILFGLFMAAMVGGAPLADLEPEVEAEAAAEAD